MTIKAKLNQLEERVAGLWPGYKTKILLALNAVVPVAALAGYMIDPQAVTAFIEEGWEALLTVQAALVGLAAWARRLTDVRERITANRNARPEKSGAGPRAVKTLAVVALAAFVALPPNQAQAFCLFGCITYTDADGNEVTMKEDAYVALQSARASQSQACADVIGFARQQVQREGSETINIEDLKSGEAQAELIRARANEQRDQLLMAMIAKLQGDSAGHDPYGIKAVCGSGERSAVAYMQLQARQSDNRWGAFKTTVSVAAPIAGAALVAAEHRKTVVGVAKNSGGNVGDVYVTKSDDTMGGEGTTTGAVGDQGIIVGGKGNAMATSGSAASTGKGSSFALDGTGNVANDGEKPITLAPGENESVLDPTTNNNNNAAGSNNDNAPIVGVDDRDGGNGVRILP